MYFGLAGFDLLTVGTSLYLSHHLNSVFERSVQANEVGLQRMASYAELGQLASLVNTPGNDVFDSRDVAQERGRLTDELRVFSAAMGEARQDALAINEPVGPALRDGLNEVETKMTSMVDEAQSIFTFFDRNEPEKAGERMATMDRRYAEVLSAVRTLQQAARDDLQAKVREQAAYAADLRSLELVIGGAVVLMIGGIGYYGHRMSRSMRESALAMAKSMTADLAAAKRRAEDSLRETEALRFTVDAQSIVSVTDTRGQIIDINDTFCRISGYSRAELLGQDHRVLNSGRHPKAFWVEMWRTVAGGESWRGEVCNRAKDGSLYWV
ncbi:MAG: PAS domain S-box protein, partial [Phycisphaerales bacterium]|nr:PAS domain S-box protein [Phycisphaerales bacterium]